MSLSFVTKSEDAVLPQRKVDDLTVLVTGAGGKIGSYFCEHYSARYRLKLLTHHPDKHPELKQWGEVVAGDIGDLEGLKKHCAGIDTVLHLAGEANAGAAWDDLLQANVVGLYNMMVAARASGCRRLIYASSIHAVSGYPKGVQVKTTDPVNPGDLYGVTKCFGEAMGRYMAEQEGLSTIALRIGAFEAPETAERSLSNMDGYVSQRDLCALIDCCIRVDDLQFAIFHGLSDNFFNRLDLTDAKELVGYRPVDDFTELNSKLRGLDFERNVRAHNQADGQDSGIREDV